MNRYPPGIKSVVFAILDPSLVVEACIATGRCCAVARSAPMPRPAVMVAACWRNLRRSEDMITPTILQHNTQDATNESAHSNPRMTALSLPHYALHSLGHLHYPRPRPRSLCSRRLPRSRLQDEVRRHHPRSLRPNRPSTGPVRMDSRDRLPLGQRDLCSRTTKLAPAKDSP
jgi:hypothetical protein